jgi:hypothetical protein
MSDSEDSSSEEIIDINEQPTTWKQAVMLEKVLAFDAALIQLGIEKAKTERKNRCRTARKRICNI